MFSNLLQYFCFFTEYRNVNESNDIYFFYIIGTSINSLILLIELFVLRMEILKEMPYSAVHRIYWVYLPIITLKRFLQEAIFYNEVYL